VSRRPSRRLFLGGAAATVALPFLPSLAHAQGAPPVRLLFWFVPNGIHMPAWTPTEFGEQFALPPILAPLAPVRHQVQVLTGLTNWPAHAPGVAGDHARGTGSFLTCMPVLKTDGADIVNGVSVDQVAAQALGDQTTFPSLQLGIAGGASVGNCDSGYSCAYTRNVSWAGPSTPLPKITSPQLLFDRLFAGLDLNLTEAERTRRRLYRNSVLDHVVGDIGALSNKLAVADRGRLDEYLTGVRELEVRVAASADAPTCAPGERPPSQWSRTEQIQLMNELTVLALRCDRTRVGSFMMGNGGSSHSFEFLGITGGHHEISHHGNSEANFERLTTIGTWQLEQFGHLLAGLEAVPEGEGTLLDHSAVYFSSEVADGNAHQHWNLPVLLCGGGGGAFTPGRHTDHTDGLMSDLFLAMLHAAGVPAESFGAESTGPLAGL